MNQGAPFLAAFAAAILAILLSGCGALGDALKVSVATADSGQTKQQIIDLGHTAGESVVDGALSKALSPEVQRQLMLLETAMLDKAHAEWRAMVGETVADLIEARAKLFAGLDADTQRIVHAAFVQAEADAPELLDSVSARLQLDVATSLNSAQKAFDQVLATERAKVDAEIAQWKWIAIGVGAGAALLIGVLMVLHWLLMRSHREVIRLLAVLSLLAVGCTPNPFVVQKVNDHLYRFPQPTDADQWQEVRDELGPGATIVKLNAPDEGPVGFSDEYAGQLGLDVHVLTIEPRDDGTVLQKVDGVFAKPDEKVAAAATDLVCNPRLVVGVHCTHGWDRTGYLVARERVMCEGWSPASAREEWHRLAHYVPYGDRVPDPGLEAAWWAFIKSGAW